MIKIFYTSLVCCMAINTALVAQTLYEKEVTAAVEELRVAMLDANRTALEELSAADLSYGHSGGLVEDKNAFVEKIARGKSDFTKITLEGQTVKISGDVAIVRHKMTGESINDGKPGTLNLSVLLIWQKQHGKWKLLARQAVKV